MLNDMMKQYLEVYPPKLAAKDDEEAELIVLTYMESKSEIGRLIESAEITMDELRE